MRVVWLEPARQDLERVRAYIAKFNPTVANRVAADLVAAADRLQHFPLRARPGRIAGTRELVTVKPYVIVYEVTDRVEILRIWHSAQSRER